MVTAFLRPSFRASRPLILELHLAGARHPELAEHLARWHREFASRAVEPSGRAPGVATVEVKALVLLLLGCCHLEDLDALEASPDALEARIARLVDALYGQG